jgi:hypothetical protein
MISFKAKRFDRIDIKIGMRNNQGIKISTKVKRNMKTTLKFDPEIRFDNNAEDYDGEDEENEEEEV